MNTATLKQQKVIDLLADGKGRTSHEIAAALGISRNSVYVTTAPLVKGRILSAGSGDQALFSKGVNFPIGHSGHRQVVHVYDCDDMPINRNHDHIGTARTYDRRPGGAAS